MKVVTDSNRVIAAIVKESTTREILFKRNFEFVAPDFIKTEIHKHRDEIIRKANISEEEFELLLALLFERIEIIPESDYEEFARKLKNEIKDPNDIPYLAVVLSTRAEGVWTHDPGFKEQQKVRIFTNIDMLRSFR